MKYLWGTPSVPKKPILGTNLNTCMFRFISRIEFFLGHKVYTVPGYLIASLILADTGILHLDDSEYLRACSLCYYFQPYQVLVLPNFGNVAKILARLSNFSKISYVRTKIWQQTKCIHFFLTLPKKKIRLKMVAK